MMAKKKNAADGPLQTGMLSFARSVQPSEGLFWGVYSNDLGRSEPIEVLEKGVRGQSSEFKTQNPGKSNPQVVEAAAVPPGCDGVELRFTMAFFPFSRKPWACDDAAVNRAYQELATKYADRGGFNVLAKLYLWNMANARFAWRNRFQSDDMRVTVEFDGKRIVFDPMQVDLEIPASLDEMTAAVVSDTDGEETSNDRSKIETLVQWIAEGLTTERRFLKVAWHAQMNEGEEVFPSQEYLREEKAKNAPSRVYAKLPRSHRGRLLQQAAMHSQKIGAALRHIDIWHGNDDHHAIAVNPYGGVQETGEVVRDKSGANFYALRADADTLLTDIDKATDDSDLSGNIHFVMANLVRGGVFGE